MRYIKESTPGGAYVIAVIPALWRTLAGDDPNLDFRDIWPREVDAIEGSGAGSVDVLRQVQNRFTDQETEEFCLSLCSKNKETLMDFSGKEILFLPILRNRIRILFFPSMNMFNTMQTELLIL